MKASVLLVLASSVLLVAGCASTAPKRGGSAAKRPAPLPEQPLPDIPEYPDLGGTYDVSAKVCVYKTLWIYQPLSDALRTAGYDVLPHFPPPNESRLENPDFIIEPLAFKHTVEKRKGESWLFTRIVVQVRRPLRVPNGESLIGYQPQTRIFQVFARRNLGVVSAVTEANCRDNVGAAIDNLLRVGAFRDALTRNQALTADVRKGQ